MKKEKARVIIDETLFSRIASGDNEALNGLYETTYRPIFALLLSYTQNYQDAEDLLQETYLKICQGAHLYSPGGNPMAWMMTIARNLYLSKYRRESRINTVNYEDVMCQIPFDQIRDTENRILIEHIFRILKEEERHVIIMHVIQGLKFREIAQITEKPLGTVMAMYHRGLKKLNKELDERK